MPFVLAVLVLLHLISLHDKAGSGNPLGIGNYVDRITFSPYYIFPFHYFHSLSFYFGETTFQRCME